MLTLKVLRLWHIYILVVILLLAGSLFVPVDTAFPPKYKVEDPAKSTLELLDSTIKIIVSLNTAMLAGASALTLKSNSWTSLWTRLDSALILLVFINGAMSYFGVYFCYMRLLTMVGASFLDPVEGGLVWSLRLQYLGIISGVTLLGLVFARIIEGRVSKTS